MKLISEEDIALIKSTVPLKIGQAIKREREKQGLTQTKLADLVGKDRQYIYKIEAGRVTINVSTLAIICKALNIKMSELIVI